MAGARQWAPLLLCLLQSAPGQGKPRMAPPQNVTLVSRNFSVYLMWLPGPGNPQNVTYFVDYQSSPTPKRWRKVKKCAGTKELVCSLMCLEKQDLYNKFKGRVQAVSPSAKSPWMESKYLDYFFEVEPAPPTLVFTRVEEILSIFATYQLPQCVPMADLKYEVHFWKQGTRNKTLFPVTPHGQPVQIPLHPATTGHHCLSARTIYTFNTLKYSEFSKPTCFLLEAPGINWPFLVLLPLLLPLLLVISTGGLIWKSSKGNPWFQQSKMPPTLDFSGHVPVVATFQPSDSESLDDLILCSQKELTRRARLTPGVKTPAALQAGCEDRAEEEEEVTDDSISFQPYIEPPSFLGQGHWIPQCSEADGVDSGCSQTLGQAEGSSAWDSEDRSWASTLDSPSWDEARTSGSLAKKGPGEGRGRDGRWEPLPLPEFPEDSGPAEEPQELSSWTTWGSSSAGRHLGPGEPPVSLSTVTFCWDSSLGEEEEEEEDGEGSETEDSGTGSWGPEGSQRTEGMRGLCGHYMAR